MRIDSYRTWALCLGLVCYPCIGSAADVHGLEPLAYNHPGLVVDLGVGLWAWPVPCDADGDGDYDLIVSCPDKPSNGVWIFENMTGDTSKTKTPVFQPARRLSATTKYVMPSYVDGRLTVLTPGTVHPNFERTGTTEARPIGVPANFYKPRWAQSKGPKVRHNQWRFADYNGDGRPDLIVGIEDWSEYGWDDAYDANGQWRNGPLHGFVFVFLAKSDGGYADPVQLIAGGQPVDVYGCPSPNFEDFDGDGDLDLLCGEFLDGFTYFENVGTRKEPRYAKGQRLTDPEGMPLRMHVQMIVPIAFDWDKDGDIDLIVGDEDGRVAFVENTGRLGKDRTPQFAQPVYFRQVADTLKCGALATPVGFDWDGDGDTDILCGNTAGTIDFFENLSGPKVARPMWASPKRVDAGGKPFRVTAGSNGSIQGPAEAKWGYTTFSVADWDADGLPDVIFNSIRGEVCWLRNIGTRTAPKLAEPQPVEAEWTTPQPRLAWGWRVPDGQAILTQWRTTPIAYDFTGDGLIDLAVLDTEGYLALFERANRNGKLVLLAPRRAFADQADKPMRLATKLAGGSGRRKICVTDWDGDGKFDFLVNSTNANFLKQTRNWVFENLGPLAGRNIEGHDVSPTVVDFDGDGVPDFLGGAEDGRLYFLRNDRSLSRKP